MPVRPASPSSSLEIAPLTSSAKGADGSNPVDRCHSEVGAARSSLSRKAGAPAEESGSATARPVERGLSRETSRPTGRCTHRPDSSVGAQAATRQQVRRGASLRMTVLPDSVKRSRIRLVRSSRFHAPRTSSTDPHPSSKKRGCASCRTSIPRPFPTSHAGSCLVDWGAMSSARVRKTGLTGNAEAAEDRPILCFSSVSSVPSL
jgi:hypothetical protein